MPQRARAQKDDIIMNETRVSPPHHDRRGSPRHTADASGLRKPPGNARNGQGNQAMKYNMSGRGFASVARATAAAAALCFAAVAPATGGGQPPTRATPPPGA